MKVNLHLVEDTSHDRESEGQEGARGHGGAGVVDWHRRGCSRGSRALDQGSRANGSHGRRYVGGNSGDGGDVDGSGVGRGDVHRDIGGGGGGSRLRNGNDDRLSGGPRNGNNNRLSGGLSDGNDNRLSGGLRHRHSDRLGARVSVVLLVGSSTVDRIGATGDANIVASAGILLGAHSWATRTVGLAVDTSSEGNVRSAGDADVVTSASILLGVASGGSFTSAAKEGETALCYD